MKIRKPCQAGTFYPASKDLLIEAIKGCFLHPIGPQTIPSLNLDGETKIKGIICPHAGFTYSGPIAAHSYAALAGDGKPDLAVIIGPNHTGLGSGVSLMLEGFWETPLGKIEIENQVAEKILNLSDIIDIDELAHQYEHSIEVQIPFLQYLYGSQIRFIPIILMLQDLKTSIEIGKTIFEAISHLNCIVIASTDLTHYETQVEANRKDHKAIEAILSLNENKLQQIIDQENLSMCGYGPTVAFITIMKLFEATNTILLKYGTSGDISGDLDSVVGYASIKASI